MKFTLLAGQPADLSLDCFVFAKTRTCQGGEGLYHDMESIPHMGRRSELGAYSLWHEFLLYKVYKAWVRWSRHLLSPKWALFSQIQS